MSENSSESESLKRRDRPRLLPDIKNKCELGGKAKSVEGLSALAGLLNKTSLKDFKENNKSKISFNEAIVPRRQKLKISQPTNKFGGLSVSKAQILRRHTLHDKSHTSRPVHVHSWHKQVSTAAYCASNYELVNVNRQRERESFSLFKITADSDW